MANNGIKQLEKLFHQALELSSAERATFVATVRAENEAQGNQLAALLANSDTREEGANSGAAAGQADPIAAVVAGSESAMLKQANADSSWIGERIGAYRIVDKIAEGGMGAVYMARRDDDAFEQTVAIKLMLRAGRDAVARERFASERQILASLNHPNIARLIDGGEAAEQFPYLVMEHIDGEAINAWCDHRRLTIRERVKLLLTVCDAVQHAHENLVIHRDIKPSNVLITADGTVKLLDFGIAKPMADPLGLQTEAGMRVMSPKHASPEQVRGEAVTTATDVYALGVLTYELLSGSFPYDLSESTREEVASAVTTSHPRLPSAAARDPVAASLGEHTRLNRGAAARARSTSEVALARALKGDLDAIVLKALNKEPHQRYSTASALAAELRAYLSNMPVIASHPTPWYRAKKLVARNKGLTLAVAAVASMAIAGQAWNTWRLTVERDRAQAESQRSARMTELMAGVFEATGPGVTHGTQLTPQRMLEHGTRRIRTALEDEHELRADMLAVIGRTYRSFGEMQSAYDLAEEVLEIRLKELSDNDERLADTFYDLGYAAFELGRAREALQHHQEARNRYAEIYGTTPSEKLATSTREISLQYHVLGDLQQAETFALSALKQLEVLHPKGSKELALAQMDLGVLYLHTGRIEQGEPLMLSAQEMRLRLLGDTHPDVTQGINNLGYFYFTAGDARRAEPYLQDSLDRRANLYGADNSKTALAEASLGRAKLERGDIDQAYALLSTAYRKYTVDLGAASSRTLQAGAMLVRVILEKSETNQALELATTLVALADSDTNVSARAQHSVATSMCRVALAIGDEELARASLKRIEKASRSEKGENTPQKFRARLLAFKLEISVVTSASSLAAAINTGETLLAEMEEWFYPVSLYIDEVRMGLVGLYQQSGEESRARGHLELVYSNRKQSQYPNSPRLVSIENLLKETDRLLPPP